MLRSSGGPVKVDGLTLSLNAMQHKSAGSSVFHGN